MRMIRELRKRGAYIAYYREMVAAEGFEPPTKGL